MCLSTLTRWFRKVTENKFGTTWKFRQHMLAQSMRPLEERVTPVIGLNALGVTYTQNFDTLANSGTSSTLPTGWFLNEAGGNSSYSAGTGSGNAGDTYSYGSLASSERAFGTLLSGTVTPTIGGSFTNNTGSVIGALDIAYTGEQWRLGAVSRTDRLDFQYSTDATSLTTGTWTDFNVLDFTAPTTTGTVGALDGNAAANRTGIRSLITGLSIADGQTVWVRWSDFNPTGADDGLAVDDFSLTPLASAFVQEPFRIGTDGYTAGTLGSQNPFSPGFSNPWVSGGSNISATGLTYSGLSTSGGNVEVTSGNRAYRNLATTYTNSSATTFYARVLVNLPTDNSGVYRAIEAYDGTPLGGDVNRTFQLGQGTSDFGPGNNEWTLKLFNNSSFQAKLGAVVPGQTELFVLKFSLSATSNADSITIWRNPVGTGAEPTGGTTLTGFDARLSTLAIANFIGAGNLISADEIRFGNAWSDVALPGTMTANLSSGTLTLTDLNGNANNLTASISGSNLVITDAAFGFAATAAGTLSNNGRTLTVPLAGITGKVVVNGGGGNDTFTLDWSGGAFTKNFDFNGGGQTGSPGDTLVTTGGTFTTITSNYTNANDGNLVLAQSGNTVTLNYTGLEPVLINAGSVDDYVFNLPTSSKNFAVLEDDGTLSNAMSRLQSTSSSFEVTDFSNPTKSLTINRGSSFDTLSVSALPDFDRSLNIGASTAGFASVTANGAVTLASGFSFAVFATGTISFPNAASDWATSGSGSIGLTTERNISVPADGSLSSVNGNIVLSANAAGSTIGSFDGISVSGTIQATGTGGISLTGKGGANVGNNRGVSVNSGGQVLGGSGGVSVDGTGGSSTANFNYGFEVTGASSKITASGFVGVTGTGGGTGSSTANVGVIVQNGGTISATGSGDVQVQGTSGVGTGGASHGIRVVGAGSAITTAGGKLDLIGAVAGGATGAGIRLATTADVSSSGGPIGFVANSMNFDSDVTVNSGAGTTSLVQQTVGIQIDLGGADGGSTLGLTDTELGQITAGVLKVGDASSGAVDVSADIMLPAGVSLTLTSGGNISLSSSLQSSGQLTLQAGAGASILPTASGNDVSANSVAFGGGGKLTIAINGAIPDSQHSRLKGLTAAYSGNNPTGDDDVDGVQNGVDNAPTIPNPDQADADADGIGDVFDLYPSTASPSTTLIDLTNLTLDLTGSYTFLPSDTITIVAGRTRIGTFTNAPLDGDTIAFGSQTLTVNYTPTAVTLKLADLIAPTVSSITTLNSSPNKGPTVQYEVLFSENVTGVDASDFAVTAGAGLTGAGVAGVVGSGGSYTVTVNTGTGVDTLRLDVIDDDTIVDGGGNKLGGTGVGNGDFTAGQLYSIDTVAPTVNVSTMATDPTSSSPIAFGVVFSESVGVTFGPGDVTVVNGTVSNLVGDGTVFTFDVTPTGPGLVGVSIAAGQANDAVGNGNLASNTVSLTYAPPAGTISVTPSGNDVVIDDTAGVTNALTVSFDGTTYSITDAAEQFQGTGGIAGATLTNGGKTLNIPAASFTGQLIISTGDGADTLLIVAGATTWNRALSYDGEGGDDALSIRGTGTQTVVYTPDAMTNGKGIITVNGNTIAFTGLEPVDFDNVGTFTLSLPGLDDVVNVANGKNSMVTGLMEAAGSVDALIFSGTSGMVGFEQAHVFRTTNVVIDTTASDGNDTITISSANNAHLNANLTFTTGAGTDSLTVNGAAAVSGTFTANVSTVNLNDNITAGTITGTATVVNVDDAPAGEIRDAIALAASGATINVAAGTFTHVGTLQVNKSVSIIGDTAATTKIFKSGAPSGNFDEAVRISANNVTVKNAQIGWSLPASPDYQGYMTFITSDSVTLNNMLFTGNYRSAVVMSGSDNLEVSDSKFTGDFGRGALRDDPSSLAGTGFLITRNQFLEDHFQYGPVNIEGGGAFGGTISFNYFASGVKAGSFDEDGFPLNLININSPNLVGDLQIVHNTFDWRDTATLNNVNKSAQMDGIYIDPLNVYTPGSINIEDNIFRGFEYATTMAAAPTVVAGKFGGAIQFDGIDDYGVFRFPDLPAYAIGDQGSLSFWVNTTDTATRNQFFEGPGEGNMEFQYRTTSGGQFYGRMNTSVNNDVAISSGSASTTLLGGWTNLVYTWDFATKELRIYVNGVQVTYLGGFDQNITPATWANVVDTVNRDFFVARDPKSNDRYFQGAMDDVAWFNTIVTPAQMAGLQGAVANTIGDTTGLIAHWTMDSVTGNQTFDTVAAIPMSIYTANGQQPAAPPEWRPTGGKFGGALEFDGLDDYGTFQSAAFDVGATGSASFWVKMDDMTLRNNFFGGPSNSGFQMQYRENSTGQFYGYPSNNGVDVPQDQVISVGGQGVGANTSRWMNLTYTWDINAGGPTDGIMRVYLDGVEFAYLASSTQVISPWSVIVNTINGEMSVGRDPAQAGNPDPRLRRFFDGLMDDVAWFNRVLTPAEILGVATSLSPLGSSPLGLDANLVAYWNMDQSSGTTTVDSKNSIVMQLFPLTGSSYQSHAVKAPAGVLVNNNVFFNNDVDVNALPTSTNVFVSDPLFTGVGVFDPGVDDPTVFYSLATFLSPAYNTATTFPVDGNIGAWQGIPVDSGDWGDAPDSYLTLMTSGGPAHATLPGGVRFGPSIDMDVDGQPTVAADGDDTTGLDDEDGLTLISTLVSQGNAVVSLDVQNLTGTAYIQGWIDFDGDGSFSQVGDQIVVNFAVNASGVYSFNFTVPATTFVGNTYARFRISTTSGLGIGGNATDGEVEDYQVAIAAAPSDVWVNDTWFVLTDVGTAGLSAGDTVVTSMGDFPVVGGKLFGYEAFATIQQGIDVVAVGGTVHVVSGLYQENPLVDKAVTLRGSNFGVSGSSMSRNPEAVVMSAGSQVSVFTVIADNVSINGFYVEGDDTATVGLPVFSGEDANVFYGVFAGVPVSNMLVQNNIITHAAIGVRGQSTAGNAVFGSVIDNNWFDSIGVFDFGYAVTLRNNFYADVTNNKMTRVFTGVHTLGFDTAGPALWSMTGNNITSYANGLWHNEQYNSSTALTVSGNQFTAEATAVANNIGVLISGVYNAVAMPFTGNTITGHDYGMVITSVPTTSTITLSSTNSIVGSEVVGVYFTNKLTFNPIGTTVFGIGQASTLNIDGLKITGAKGVGIKVDASGGTVQTLNVENDTDVTGAVGATTGIEVFSKDAVALIQNNDNSISGFAIGIDVDGGAATITNNHIFDNGTGIRVTNAGTATIGTNDFDGGAGDDNGTDIRIDSTAGTVTINDGNEFAGDDYFVDNRSAQAFDFTGFTLTTYEGLNKAMLADAFRIEDKLYHAPDAAASGLIRINAGQVYVTNPGTGDNDESIQLAVNAATGGDTIHVEAGAHNLTTAVNVTKTLTFLGAQSGVDARTRGVVSESIIDISAQSSVNAYPSTNFIVLAGVTGVIFDGFTLQGAYGAQHTGSIWMQNGSAGTQVLNNIIQDNAVGLFLDNDSAILQTKIQQNLFRNNTKTGSASGHSIYADQFTTGGTLQNVLIQDNDFTNAAFTLGSWAVGIGNGGPNLYANITITGNEVTNHGRGFYFDGTTGLQVTNNTVTGTSRYAIGLFAYNLPNQSATITGNTLVNNAKGVYLSSFAALDAYSGTLTLSGNSYTTGPGEFSIYNDSDTAVDATGDTFNGILAGTATTAQQFVIVDTIVDGVDVAGAGLVRTKANNVYVTVNSFNNGVFWATPSTAPHIQRGTDVASNGDTVTVQSGIYNGDVTIGAKTLTVTGEATNVVTNTGKFTATGTGADTLTLIDLSISGAGSAFSGYGALNIISNGVAGGGYIISGSVFSRSGDQPIAAATLSGLGEINVTSGSGDDSFSVTPDATTEINIAANNPVVPVGDILTLDLTGVTAPVFTPGVPLPNGGLTSGNRADVNWTSIETLITLTGGAVALYGDNFRVVRSGLDLQVYDITTYGSPILVFNNTYATITTLSLFGTAADSYVEVLFSAGNAVPSGGIFYDGGVGGNDGLQLFGAAGIDADYTPDATTSGDGSVVFSGSATGTIEFDSISEFDVTTFDTFTVSMPSVTNVISVQNGKDFFTGLLDATVISGTSNAVAMQTVTVRGSGTLEVVTPAASDDAFNVAAGVDLTPAGITNLTLDGKSDGADAISLAGGLNLAGTATLTSGGTITQAAGVIAATNLVASAVTGIDVNTTVTNLTATNSGSGNVVVDETDGVNVLNVSATNGSVTVTTTTGDINLTSASASATVTLTATAGAITDANAAANNITAAAAALSASTGIGVGDAIETQLANLEAGTATGGIAIANTSGALAIGGVTAALSGVRALTSGPVSLSNTGDINIVLAQQTVRSPDAVTVSSVSGSVTTGGNNYYGTGSGAIESVTALTTVSAGGNLVFGTAGQFGDVYGVGINLTAGGNMVVDAQTFVDTFGAPIVANVTGDVSILGSSRIGSYGGTVSITALGTFTISGGTSRINTTLANPGNNVTVQATSIAIGGAGIIAGTGTASLTATAGAITDGNAAAVNVNAANGVFSAVTGINLDTTLTNLTATNTGAGDITIRETNGVNVLNVAASSGNASVSTTTGSLNVTTASASASVTLTATAGAITDANAGANNVTAADGVFTAATGINLDTTLTNLTATNTGAGDITIDEADGVNVLNAAASNGNVTITTTTGNLNVTTVSATGNANLQANAGAITDANAGANNVTAADGVFSALTGIDLDTTLTNLTATNTGAGDITIRETDGVNVLNVAASNGNASVSTTTGNLNVTTASASASVTLTATAGAITDANAGANNVTAVDGVFSAATGIDLDTTVATIVATTAGAGAITIDELDAVTLTNVTSANGPITLTAGGAIAAVNVVSSTDADANDISITAATGDITVTTVNAGTTAGDVSITATAGSILDDANDATRITGDVVDLSAGKSIGGPGLINSVDTTANSLTLFAVGGVGVEGIWVVESDAVTVTSATTTNGVILLQSGGTMTATLVTAGGASRTMRLRTTAGDINVGTLTATSGVAIDAAGAITDGNAAANNVNAPDLVLRAGTGIGAGDAIETTVSNLAAKSTAGNIEIANTGPLTITSVTVIGVTETGVSGGGSATITAASPLTVAADVLMVGNIDLTAGEISDATTWADDLTVNTGVTVKSSTGNVKLCAGDDIILNAGSLVEATLGTVTVEAGCMDLDGQGDLILNGSIVSGGALNLCAVGDITVGTLTSSDTITIFSMMGAIIDSVGASTITAVGLAMKAADGVGTLADPIESSVSNLEGQVTGTGGFFVVNSGKALTIGGIALVGCGIGTLTGISTTDGDISVVNDNNITVGELVAAAGVGGDVSLAGNFSTATAGTFIGVTVNGGNVTTVDGNITLQGKGGTTGANNKGVQINGRAVTAGGSGSISINGIGGGAAGASSGQMGVEVLGASTITSGVGVQIVGQGGGSATSTGSNRGIDIAGASSVTTTGSGTISFQGTGGLSLGSGNVGIRVIGGSLVSTNSGDLTMTGTGGGGFAASGSNRGVYLTGTNTLVSAGGTGKLTLTGFGGTGTSANNFGVNVQLNAVAQSANGNVIVNGTGGGTGTSATNHGVALISGGQIKSVGSGNLSITGVGGVAPTGNGQRGVSVASGSIISTASGDATINGTGGGSGISNNGFGVYVTGAGSQVNIGGTGNLTVTGQSGSGSGGGHQGVRVAAGALVSVNSGNATINGTSNGAAGNSNYGTFINGATITVGGSGTLGLTGQGSTVSTGNYAGGVGFASATVSTNSGNLTINGTAGGVAATAFTYGVYANNSSITAGGTGGLTISGTGGPGTGTNNIGVGIVGSSSIQANNGNINITGTEGGGVFGLGFAVGGTSVIKTTGTGNITVNANSMLFGVGTSTDAGANIVTLLQKTAGVGFDLGSALDPIGGPVSLSDAELDTITAGKLRIGNASTGAVVVSADVGPALTSTMKITTPSTVTGTAGGIIIANLAIDAGNTVNFTDPNSDVGTLAIVTSNDDATWTDANGFDIGTVDGVIGVNVGSANATLSAGGLVTDTDAVIANGLALRGTGSFVLDAVGFAINSFAADTSGNVTLVEATGFDIGTVMTVVGVTNVGTLSISTAGSVTDTDATKATNVVLRGTGTYVLDVASNDWDVLASDNLGDVTVVDADGFSVGTAGGVIGVNLGSATFTVTSNGLMNQTQAIIAANFAVFGSGPYTLTLATNDVTFVAGNVTGDFNFVDANNLTVGTVGLTVGITSTADVRLNASGGNLLLADAINTSGIARLLASGTVSATAAGIDVTASGLSFTVGGGITLETAVATMAGSVTGAGDIDLTQTGSSTIGTITVFSETETGLNAANGKITVFVGDVGKAASLVVANNVTASGDINLTVGEFSDHPTCADDLIVNTGVTVQSTAGDIALRAGDDIWLQTGSLIDAFGNLELTAGFNDLDGCGELILDGDIKAGGNIDICAIDDIKVGSITSTGGTVTLYSMMGKIYDGNGAANNIKAPALAMKAATGIGYLDALETQVDRLEAEVALNGIFVDNNTTTLEIGGVSPGCGLILDGVEYTNAAVAGEIVVTNTGDLIVGNFGEGVSSAKGDITLKATGVTADVQTTGNFTAVFAADGDVFLQAGDDVRLGDPGTLSYGDVVGNTIDLTAGDDIVVSSFTWVISTVGTIVATPTGDFDLSSAGGYSSKLDAATDVVINATGNINVSPGGAGGIFAGGDIDMTAAAMTLANRVVAGDDITLTSTSGDITDTTPSGFSYGYYTAVDGDYLTVVSAGKVNLDTIVNRLDVDAKDAVTLRELDGVLVDSIKANGALITLSNLTGSSTFTLVAGDALENSSTVDVQAGTVLDLNGDDETIGALQGLGNVLLGGQTLKTGINNASTTFNGVISGNNASFVIKEGTGTMTMGGANTYTGTTQIIDGAIKLGGNNILADGSKLIVQTATATFDMNGFNEKVAAVSLIDGQILGGAISKLESTTDYDVRNGLVTASLIGGVNLIKTTAGTVTLAGANTYSGKTAIQGGTLDLSGSLSGAGLDVFLETSGVTLTGSGTGTITNRGVVVLAGKTNTFVQNLAGLTNGPTATGLVINAGASASVLNNTIQNNQIGVLVDGGTALLEGNDLSFNNKGAPGVAAGLVAQNKAIVDAGQNPTIYYTHFTLLGGGTGPGGASAGNNVFSGYPYLGVNDWQPNVPKAIRNLNTAAPGVTYGKVGPQFGTLDLTAMNNTFDGSPSLFFIEKQLYHDVDQSILGFIAYGNSSTPATLTDMRYYAVNPTLTYNSGPPDFTQLTAGDPSGTFQASSIRRLRTTYDGFVFIDMTAGASTIPIGGVLPGTGGVQLYKKNGPALTNSNNNGFVNLAIVNAFYDQNTGAYTTDFAFSNPPGKFFVEPNGSLTDGNYDLGLVGSLIQGGGPGGAALTNPTTRSFHRFFGDFNGDRRVNNVDLAAMQAALGTLPGSPAYRGYFNFDTIDLITSADYNAFVRRYRYQLLLNGTASPIVP